MSQYQESMARMMGETKKAGSAAVAIAVEPIDSPKEEGLMESQAVVVEGMQVQVEPDMPQFAEVLRRHADYILRVVVPVLWTVLLLLFLDRDSFLRTMFMPAIGVIAALLANCIPIGGGIVYVPLLSLLGTDIQLSVGFSVATMSIGNGVFGFLHWLKADPSAIVWESFFYTVLPCSLGSAVGILLMPPVPIFWIKKIFGLFCLLVAAYVAFLSYAHGAEIKSSSPTTRKAPTPSPHQWMVVGGIFFLAGLLLVVNIGVGPALIAYFLLGDTYIGYTQKQAIVTGIITGGWVSIMPFFLHLVALGDVPVVLWVMVLPGVYAGALLAPRIYEVLGLKIIFGAFSLFLLLSAGMFLL